MAHNVSSRNPTPSLTPTIKNNAPSESMLCNIHPASIVVCECDVECLAGGREHLHAAQAASARSTRSTHQRETTGSHPPLPGHGTAEGQVGTFSCDVSRSCVVTMCVNLGQYMSVRS